MRKYLIKQDYKRILQYAFILTLALLIAGFYFSDRTAIFKQDLPVVKFKAIAIIEIPRTIQKKEKKPRPIRPSIPVASDEIDIIDEVELEESSISAEDIGLGDDATDETYAEARQILETVPRDTKNRINGRITLNLKIDKHGKVEICHIKKSSLSDSAYVSVVISAAMKSLWKPALKNGKPVESWVIKTYSFDN